MSVAIINVAAHLFTCGGVCVHLESGEARARVVHVLVDARAECTARVAHAIINGNTEMHARVQTTWEAFDVQHEVLLQS
jgi:hypothetical protein